VTTDARPERKFTRDEKVWVRGGSGHAIEGVVDMIAWSNKEQCWTYTCWYPHPRGAVGGMAYFPERQLKARA